jgi:hypothetical protein
MHKVTRGCLRGSKADPGRGYISSCFSMLMRRKGWFRGIDLLMWINAFLRGNKANLVKVTVLLVMYADVHKRLAEGE